MLRIFSSCSTQVLFSSSFNIYCLHYQWFGGKSLFKQWGIRNVSRRYAQVAARELKRWPRRQQQMEKPVSKRWTSAISEARQRGLSGPNGLCNRCWAGPRTLNDISVTEEIVVVGVWKIIRIRNQLSLSSALPFSSSPKLLLYSLDLLSLSRSIRDANKRVPCTVGSGCWNCSSKESLFIASEALSSCASPVVSLSAVLDPSSSSSGS